MSRFKIFDDLVEGVQVIDPTFIYAYVNNVVAVQGKCRKEDLIGVPMVQKYPGIENTEMFRLIRKCMDTGMHYQLVNEFEFPDKTKGYFDLRMQKIDEGVLIFSYDITEKRVAEILLQQANDFLDREIKLRTSDMQKKNEELQQFNYLASHDLQEPLRTIINYIDVLEEDFKHSSDADAQKYIHAIRTSAMRMISLIKSIQQFSSLEDDTVPAVTSLNKVVKKAIVKLQPLIKSTHAEILVEELPEIRVLEEKIQLLFEELILNAIKFRKSDEDPFISISYSENEEQIIFSVKDNGIGIDEKYFEKIFQMFQKLHLKSEFPGNGAGLAICKKIVEMHHGRIWLTSKAGKGSTFYCSVSKSL